MPASSRAGEAQDRQGQRHAEEMEKEGVPTQETLGLGVIAGRSGCDRWTFGMPGPPNPVQAPP